MLASPSPPSFNLCSVGASLAWQWHLQQPGTPGTKCSDQPSFCHQQKRVRRFPGSPEGTGIQAQGLRKTAMEESLQQAPSPASGPLFPSPHFHLRSGVKACDKKSLVTWSLRDLESRPVFGEACSPVTAEVRVRTEPSGARILF